jgi:AraC-like DNA-binding protein
LKVKHEAIEPDVDSSFKILLTPNLNELFYWHFHAEYEIVYVEADKGIRHIGDHISQYEQSDLAFIGPNIPHLNFDYGVKTIAETIVVQMKENFLGDQFFSLPEIASIRDLFLRANRGLAFYGKTKKLVGEQLKQLVRLPHFEQLIALLQIFHLLSKSEEYLELGSQAIRSAQVLKDQQRLHRIYHFIDSHFQHPIETSEVAQIAGLTKAAFCRYFKKSTHLTFTEFVNQYRINQSKKILLQNKTVTEACYDSGFENLSYFNKTFKKFTGENPSAFRKKINEKNVPAR